MWQATMKYSSEVQYDIARTLSALEQILPMPLPTSHSTSDRYEMWVNWLQQARKAGLLSKEEHNIIERDVARNM